MPRGLDHIVWPARDLDGLAETFRRLGFTVGRRNRHPWGTVNHIVQFDGCFLELLGFADDRHTLPEGDPAVPFAGFCADFLAEHPAGAAMLVLRSDDARADARAFAEQGLGRGQVLPFSRAAQGPDGGDRTVAFTIAFADIPGLGAFVCQQHRPENFWNPAAQRHANGAEGIAAVEVAMPAREGTAALGRFAGLETNGDWVLSGGCRLDVRVQRQDRAGIAAVGIRVHDLEPLRRRFQADGIAFSDEGRALAVDPARGGTTRLRFVVR